MRGGRYGLRYVEDGQVKIVWYEGGKRLGRRTVSQENTRGARDEADAALSIALAPRGPVPLTLGKLLSAYLKDAPVRRNPKTIQPLRAKTLAGYAENERAIAAGLTVEIEGKPVMAVTLAATSLRRSDVRAWVMRQRVAGLAEGTIARRVDYLKAVYRWAVGEVEVLAGDPLTKFQSPSRKGRNLPYSEEEGHALFEAVLALSNRAWRFKLLVLLESAYGVRSLQPLGLRWTDIDLDRVTQVPVNAGTASLVGAIAFRQAVPGSKGQPTRVMPIVPFVREAVLEAHRHRNPASDWVFWSWPNAAIPSSYGSMNGQLKKLEKKAGVVHVKGRAFHAFRRALSNELVKKIGLLQAAGWLGDTPEVLMRSYLSASQKDTMEAAEYLIRRFNRPTVQPQTSQPVETLDANSLPDNTGAVGLEPTTCRDGQVAKPDKTIPRRRYKRSVND